MQKNRGILAGTIIISGVIMTGTSLSTEAQTSEAIRPFRVNVPENKLVDLKRRILATQWPEQELVKDETQGVQFATMQGPC
jgi:hypothetical protein